MADLLSQTWTKFDSYELRLLLDKHFGGPGQYDGRDKNPDKFYLPLAGAACEIGLTFRDEKIVAIEPGPAFDAEKWRRLSPEIEKSILGGPLKVGRACSFSGYRVSGWWAGAHSGVQILPPPDHAPRAPVEMADHPFILEFPIKASDFPQLTNYRRIREHRNLTLLLNLLLAGGVSLPPLRPKHFWASVPYGDGRLETRWLQEFFFLDFGPIETDALSRCDGEKLKELEPETYFANVGYDGLGLRVPADLDDLLFVYLNLGENNRTKLDRAAIWMDTASRQWADSASSSFASLVTACEALTERGRIHHVYCKECGTDSHHEVPGATKRFRDFFQKYAPGTSLEKRRSQMYALRSSILHGSKLMQLDQNRRFGWDPPGENQTELHRELWSLTRTAARNWLKSPPL